MKRIRVGLVGAGFAARFHLDALKRVYGVQVEVAGVTSRRPESRTAFGREHHLPVFDDVEAMLPHVDLVTIVSPPNAHEEGMLAAAQAGKAIICEKPLTGYFGPPGAGEEYHGDRDPKEPMLAAVLERLQRVAKAVRESGVFFGYAENFVYAPPVQKEREIVATSRAQILRMMGEESHNGSHSPVYGMWRFGGGGSLMGKGCHPLGAILYLKQVEGLARLGKPIRPVSVSARVHQLTRLPGYADKGYIRTDYHDIEDYGLMHVVFEDGTIADVMTSEVVLGGVYDYVEVFANNHRTRCNISPVHMLDVYNPHASEMDDVYLLEKASSKEGWTPTAADEHYMQGTVNEVQDFLTCAANEEEPQSGLALALDSMALIYAAYLSDERHGAAVEIPRL